jgi:sugar phosphate isomerase/epimerase
MEESQAAAGGTGQGATVAAIPGSGDPGDPFQWSAGPNYTPMEVAMQFGAMNFPVREVAAEIDALAAMGFDYLELTMDPPAAHHEILIRQAGDIRRSLRRHQMGLVCHLPTFVSIADLAPGIRRASVDEVLESLAASAVLEAPLAVLHPGYVKGLGIHVADRVHQLAHQSLDTILARAAALGVTVAVENLPSSNQLFSQASDFVDLLDRHPATQITLDIAHACIGDLTGGRALAFINRFAERIGHIHLSDHNGRWDEHLALGHGRIGLAPLMNAVLAAGYDGRITLEVFTPDPRLVVESLETARKLVRRGQ